MLPRLIILTLILISLTHADDTPKEIKALSQKAIGDGVEGRKTWALEAKKAAPGYICVRTSGVAWVYKSPPHTGSGHGDGVASFTLKGIVVDSSYKPMKEVRFTEKPTRQFGGVDKATEKAKSLVDGSFSFDASVGAAITMGEHGGDVYQSGFKTFIVSKEGYEALEVIVGYGCPDLYIQLTKKTPKPIKMQNKAQ
jgi:hypothetical protein